MIAELIICTNFDEMEKAEKLGFDIPEAEYKKSEIIFSISDVYYAYINTDGDINVNICNNIYAIAFNKEIWETLKTKFK